MKITGTFLDEISFDIPHQNWGVEEWDRDFSAMKQMGIRRVIMIRSAAGNFMAFPSKTIAARGCFHRPPVDLMKLFLDLAEKYGFEFYAGTWHSQPGNCQDWNEEKFRTETAINRELIDEINSVYGRRRAFAGWYLTHEVCSNKPGVIELFRELGTYAKRLSGGKPVLISPYFAGVKSQNPAWAGETPLLSPESHREHWETIFREIAGAVDIVAFQDGHLTYCELPLYLSITRELAERYHITCWSNIESFDRDMPWNFPPIKWEKFLWKLESAASAGIQEGITFEFSHFMSPNSMYPSAAGLYRRYCEYIAANR